MGSDVKRICLLLLSNCGYCLDPMPPSLFLESGSFSLAAGPLLKICAGQERPQSSALLKTSTLKSRAALARCSCSSSCSSEPPSSFCLATCFVADFGFVFGGIFQAYNSNSLWGGPWLLHGLLTGPCEDLQSSNPVEQTPGGLQGLVRAALGPRAADRSVTTFIDTQISRIPLINSRI